MKRVAVAVLLLSWLGVAGCGENQQSGAKGPSVSGTYTPDAAETLRATVTPTARASGEGAVPGDSYAERLAAVEALLEELGDGWPPSPGGAAPVDSPKVRDAHAAARDAHAAVEDLLGGLGEGSPPRPRPDLPSLLEPFLFDLSLDPSGSFAMSPASTESVVPEARGRWKHSSGYVELTYDDEDASGKREWLPTSLELRETRLVWGDAPGGPVVFSRRATR